MAPEFQRLGRQGYSKQRPAWISGLGFDALNPNPEAKKYCLLWAGGVLRELQDRECRPELTTKGSGGLGFFKIPRT